MQILRILEEWGYGKKIKGGFIFFADRIEIGKASSDIVSTEGLAIQLTVTDLRLHMVYIIRDKSKLIELKNYLEKLIKLQSPEII